MHSWRPGSPAAQAPGCRLPPWLGLRAAVPPVMVARIVAAEGLVLSGAVLSGRSLGPGDRWPLLPSPACQQIQEPLLFLPPLLAGLCKY